MQLSKLLAGLSWHRTEGFLVKHFKSVQEKTWPKIKIDKSGKTSARSHYVLVNSEVFNFKQLAAAIAASSSAGNESPLSFKPKPSTKKFSQCCTCIRSLGVSKEFIVVCEVCFPWEKRLR